MPQKSRPNKTADEIAEMAARGEDVSAYFTNDFTVVRPVSEVVQQLNSMAEKVNVSRQALIKTLLTEELS